jgi:hypothetical protein
MADLYQDRRIQCKYHRGPFLLANSRRAGYSHCGFCAKFQGLRRVGTHDQWSIRSTGALFACPERHFHGEYCSAIEEYHCTAIGFYQFWREWSSCRRHRRHRHCGSRSRDPRYCSVPPSPSQAAQTSDCPTTTVRRCRPARTCDRRHGPIRSRKAARTRRSGGSKAVDCVSSARGAPGICPHRRRTRLVAARRTRDIAHLGDTTTSPNAILCVPFA